MARVASGSGVVKQARKAIADAATVEQLRQAQAVIFPLDHGLSLAQTAKMIGVSVGWTCRLRNAFIRGDLVGDGSRPARGGRRRENFTPEREKQVLQPFLERARHGGVLVVPELKPLLEAELGREMALSSVYNLLHRHGWRKLAPDKHHPQHNVQAQQDWKKNSPKTSAASARTGPRVRRSR